EEEFAKYIGSKYAVAVANGTAALHLSILALGVQPGDKVITTPITFAASANAVRYAGGEVIFADIEPDSYILDIKKVEDILKKEKNVKGIIPVDFAGYPGDMEAFRKLANKYGIWILEDACHAPGGFFVDSKGENQFCGNGQYNDLAIYSFHPVKHIATGEGGMITTNNKALYEKLALLRTHGITKDSERFQNSPEFANAQQPISNSQWPGWYYEMQELGFNYRLSDMQAALGASQLKRADIHLKRRREIAEKYDNAIAELEAIKRPETVLDKTNKRGHAYHLYVIQTEKRLELYNYLREHKIFTQVHYIPVHLQPYYKQFGWKEGDMPIAEAYYEKCLSLPMYHGMTDDEQDYVINCISDFFKEK
ncbi:MAG: aminotransferase class I/II-fold pyridoxal phosphate-dependent enzyme, partial [Salinivirgaceae bacterium]|nr:aminotransferase class I/II-fold pyridoxal phosphate-dependent enzyme [Salinivirgaceae bacterium]